MIKIKSSREISLMEHAGRVLGNIFKELEGFILPGVSTKDIDSKVAEIIASNNCIASELGYYGYPASACTSVNDVLVHGIPSESEILKSGDIVSVDIVVDYQGYKADAARTFLVGEVSEKASRLVEVTKQSFFEAVKLIKPGIHLGDVSEAIQKFNESHGYSVTRDFTGHGIGSSMHEDPNIPNYGKSGTGVILQEGMALAIEPMVLEGKSGVRVMKDGWTTKSKDGKLTAHYENTVVVTSDGYKIITMYEGEN